MQTVRSHLVDEGIDVLAHEVELVLAVRFTGVHRYLGRWKSEDQPSTANVDVGEAQHIAEECAIRFSIGAVDDDVRAVDHVWSSRLLPAPITAPNPASTVLAIGPTGLDLSLIHI